ncbi:RNA polymerase-associated protein rtf1 [Saxophila tyrrhenica]|uniref:RNA polymerase-associated protein rtf1 n=1 Tax=Saxophila tyrrhenica TaxID=1690608 RepID=A0AAV9P9C7_9PEZI|nr:RNA polymerase-associated protein rtf1 [Saxophila tyrrhenica]
MSGDDGDLEAELLAMAGDDSSDDEGSDAGEVKNQTQVADARSPSVEPKQSVEKSEEPSTGPRRGVAQKVRKKGRKKVLRREIQDELNDLADSPSPPGSPGSNAMSESPVGSPDRASSPADDEPLFPVEGQFTSESDREHILSLPEIERESILADRAAQSLKKQQDEKLKQLLASKSGSKNKRKAAAAELDDEPKSSRAKTQKAGRSALDDYKKAREAKGAERTGRFDLKSNRRPDSRSPSSASDRDAEGESEVEWADTTSSRRDEPPAEMRDFERCRVGRTNFAKVCFYPKFEETMKGCYARVSIGMNRDTGQNMYRMTQIKGFTEGKPYMLEAGQNAKSFMCDIYAVVAHGAAEKPWPLSACSDSKIAPDEFQRYIETMQKEKLRVPKKAALVQKLNDIHAFLNPQWTEDALNTKFSKQREMQKRLDPANIAKAKKDAILKRKADAEEAHDDEELARCDAELAALENNAATNGARPAIKASPVKPTTMSQQDRLAILNQKNRSKTSDEVRKALLEERRKRERAIAEAKAKKAAAAEEEARLKKQQADLLGVPGADMKELFGDMSDASRAGTPMSGVSTPKLRRSRQGTPMNGVREKSKLGMGAKKMKDGEGDELADLDLGIDVEI